MYPDARFRASVRYTITIIPAMSDFSNVTYKLVKLTSDEMEWQREGTTYSVGTWGVDYRHFVKIK